MDKDELIANYFLGNLTPDEEQKFEYLMQTDTDFKKDVEFQSQVKDAIFRHERHNLKQRLQDVEKDLIPKNTNKIKWLVAAAILISLSVGYYIFDSSYTYTELYAIYFEPAPNIVHPIVRDGIEDNDETKAFVAYQKQDYKLAAQLFDKVFQDTKTSEILFYEAISLMEINNIDQAIEKFEIHKKYNDLLSNKTHWYMALAYIKQNNIEKAKDVLNLIINNQESYNYKKAKELLRKL
ncbi:tol-pal system YbgF family protein [Geojedonia litorea]|uniref:Tol-pal system YbgF family protein n=1 Tax=Geojedonia litorea TaxID=1268269 RepID=A0ABV9N1R8_9FLAO